MSRERNTVEPKNGTGNANLTFNNWLYGLSIINIDTAPHMTVTVMGTPYLVPAGFSFDIDIGPFKRATVTATGSWYIVGLI